MKRLHSKIVAGALAAGVSLLMLTGCSAKPHSSQHGPMLMTAWVADWDAESGREDGEKIRHDLRSMVYFRTYFTDGDKIVVPDSLLSLKGSRSLERPGEYLSFTNDFVPGKGTAVQKDLAVLQRVLKDEPSMNAHVAELVRLTKEKGFNGIELDYERVFKDEALAKKFVWLISKLQYAAVKNDLKLRVVLEPSADVSLDYCKGPDYVVMLYNLYGLHSGPGPKADFAFIAKTLKKMRQLPGNVEAAVSTGGCLWEESGKKHYITEAEAVAMAKGQEAKPAREDDSGVLHFSFRNRAGQKTEVWYADETTLNMWLNEIEANGIKSVNIWRLGGNLNLAGVK